MDSFVLPSDSLDRKHNNWTNDKEVQTDVFTAPGHRPAEQQLDTGCPPQCRPCRPGWCCAGSAGSESHPGCSGRWRALCWSPTLRGLWAGYTSHLRVWKRGLGYMRCKAREVLAATVLLLLPLRSSSESACHLSTDVCVQAAVSEWVGRCRVKHITTQAPHNEDIRVN